VADANADGREVLEGVMAQFKGPLDIEYEKASIEFCKKLKGIDVRSDQAAPMVKAAIKVARYIQLYLDEHSESDESTLAELARRYGEAEDRYYEDRDAYYAALEA
jgi:hypothetical protein